MLNEDSVFWTIGESAVTVTASRTSPGSRTIVRLRSVADREQVLRPVHRTKAGQLRANGVGADWQAGKDEQPGLGRDRLLADAGGLVHRGDRDARDDRSGPVFDES